MAELPFSQKYVITQNLYFLVERSLTLFPFFLEEEFSATTGALVFYSCHDEFASTEVA